LFKNHIFPCFRTMPVAVLVGMSIVSSIYLLANCAYFTVLDPSQFLESNAIANRFANATMGKLSFLVPLFVCILMIGAVNSTVFSASR
jgi:amino acid transporter